MSVFPYAYRMIESFRITEDATQISIYAGMLITAFAFAEFSTGMIWGRVSDRVGRKPVLIMGLIGTCLSMVFFGFSRNLYSAVLARALGGFLNGNVGVLQTTVAELVKKKEHQPRAYSIMPFVWCLGSIIGPAMGGALAMPCEAYPSVFSRGGVFDTYPFLLPNLVCVVILILGITNGILFIEETHPVLKHNRDRGRELGDCFQRQASRFLRRFGPTVVDTLSPNELHRMPTDSPPGYRSTESSPLLTSVPGAPQATDLEKSGVQENRGLSKTFTRQVILIIVGYGILAYHSVSFDTLMPTFLSEERSNAAPRLPFKFSGGFGMTTKTIGFMMAVQGVYSMMAQLWLFPFIVRRIGTLNAFRLVMLIWPLLYFAVPYLVLLPRSLQSSGIYLALLTKITFHVIAFPSNAILLANAAHSKSVLGTINGVAASTACLARAFGPTVTGSIHSAGLKFGYNGFAWWVSGLVCAIGAIEAYLMEETEGRLDHISAEEEDSTSVEPLYHNTSVDEPDSKKDDLSHIDDLDINTETKHGFHLAK